VLNNAVAQEMLGIDHDAEFLALARQPPAHLSPKPPQPPGYFKRRQRPSDTTEWPISISAVDRPGLHDNVVLLDSTPVNATSRCGPCRSGCTAAKVIIAEKGYLSRQPAATIHQHDGALLPGPNRQHEPGHGPHLAADPPIHQSIF
jgi:hypothetical protein